MNKLFEDNRNDLIRKSKRSDNYVPDNQYRGKNRYQRRLYSKIAPSVKEYNQIDMNKLFKDNIIELTVIVNGETDTYNVKVSWGGFLTSLQAYMEDLNEEDLDFRVVSRALSDSFNNNDVYVWCSCPDWQYRQAYWSTIEGTNAGPAENRPSDITNPNDTKGAGCKHVNLVLNNLSWQMKVASVIFNYINYMKKHYERLYADIIYPAIYEKKYEEPVQLDIDSDKINDLDTSQDIIDTSNKWAKAKNQFQKGNEYRFKVNPELQGQKHFNFNDLMSD